ncbi:MAG: GNAT family N-acetyltransferase [Promethearchaeota archaeon]
MDKKKIKDKLEFRTVNQDEIEELSKIISIAFKKKVSAEEYKKVLESNEDGKYVNQFIALYSGKVVGGVRADHKPLYFIQDGDKKPTLHECGEINNVCTHPDFQRLGIARTLLRMAIDYMNSKNWELALLQADPNYHAHVLYESEGFHVLPSTGDLIHVALGKGTVSWYYYSLFSLLLPLIILIAPRFAPMPPNKCLKLLNTKVKSKKDISEQRPLKGKIIHVTGEINEKHSWVREWRREIEFVTRNIQGIFNDIKDIMILEKNKINERFPRKILDSFSKNKYIKKFIEMGGKKYNVILLIKNEKKENKEILNTEFQNSKNINDNEIIGGLIYIIRDFSRGRIKVITSIIEVIWIKKEYQNKGWGSLLLEQAKNIIGNYFPFIICRSSSGNLQYRKAVKKAGFKIVGGGITQVKNLNNDDLYNFLKETIKPWYLTL